MRRRIAQRAAGRRCSSWRCWARGRLYVDLSGVSTFVLPAPARIAVALWDNAGLLSANLAPTAEEVVLGIALALGLRLRARRC